MSCHPSRQAAAKGQAFLLEHAVKRTKAEQYTQARESGATQGDAEHLAITSKAYQHAVEALANARERLDKAEVNYEAKKAHFEAWRTLEASNRMLS